jgi:DNA-binding CsgD family transcriptional regulator
MIGRFFLKHRIIFLYGTSMAILLILLKWLELRFVIYDHALEMYAGAIALVFTALGIWLALKLSKPKIHTVIIEKRAEDFILNEKELAFTGMSKRELEVLELMAGGLSNQEIAARLFVSLNTVKTHSSKIFEKMDVQRRTQAVEKAKRLNLIR